MENNGFQNWMLRLVIPLAIAGVLGAVGLAIGQSSIDERVKANTHTIKEHKPLINSIPVIQNDIEHMQVEMKEQHQKILQAIKEIRQ